VLRKPSGLRGALLIEALIATMILAIGVVASLRVFSGALSASSRSMKTREVHRILNDQIFGWFLDPTAFDSSAVDVMPKSAEAAKMASQVSVQKLQPAPKEKEDEQDEKIQSLPQSRTAVTKDVEFYEVNFEVSDSRKKYLFQHFFYLSQYGKQKKS